MADISHCEGKLRREIKESEQYTGKRIEGGLHLMYSSRSSDRLCCTESERRKTALHDEALERMQSGEKSVKELRDLVAEIRVTVNSLERTVSEAEENRAATERSFRSTAESMQREAGGRMHAEFDFLKQSVQRNADTLMKVLFMCISVPGHSHFF